jgi:hypothetical protein
MEGRIHREEMREEVATGVDQAVDPLDPDRPVEVGLDGKGGIVERARVIHGPVAPHRCHRQAGRQDLLPELLDGDLVVIDPSID